MDIALNSGMSLLKTLISAAGWHGNDRRLFEAVPHMSDRLKPSDLIRTLENLGVPVTSTNCALRDVTKDDCPALFVNKSGKAIAILDARPGEVFAADADQKDGSWQPTTRARGQLVRLERFDLRSEEVTFETFWNVSSGFKGMLSWLVLSSFMTNVTGLATPLLIMIIYDRVIPSGSVDLVVTLAFAVAIILVTDACFRYARTSAVAYMGSVIERRLGLALFRKLMGLPIDQIQKSDVEQQISRFKQFESLRDFFTGQILTTLLDLPFTLIFFAVLAVLAPQVSLLILGLGLVFAIATVIILPIQKNLNAVAASDKNLLQSHVFETAKNQHAIQRLGLSETWSDKNAILVRKAAQSSRKATSFQLISQSFGQSIMTVAGIGAIVLSTKSAINGDMSFGALIAVMSLVWKILTPLQSLFSNAAQVSSFLTNRNQSDRVLGLPQEMVRGAAQSHQKSFEGKISITGVTHRYPQATSPALSQISLEFEARDLVIICGDNSSGKTTLFNLICGFYQPTVGSVQLDDINIRQIAVDDLRQSIAYGQSRPELFYGTIFQNFRLASPSIQKHEAEHAIEQMDLSADVSHFEDGIDTRLSESFRSTLPTPTLRALTLARTFAQDKPVCLLNEPLAGLDQQRRKALIALITRLKGSRTIVIATQDPALLHLGDHFVFLDQGRVVVNDKGQTGRKKLTAMLNRNGDR